MAEQMIQDKASEMAAKQTIPAGYKQTEVGLFLMIGIFILFMSWLTLAVERHLLELNMKSIINVVCTHG